MRIAVLGTGVVGRTLAARLDELGHGRAGGAGEPVLAGKVLIDVSNPLDYSRGMPPTLDPVNTDSLGEQIQPPGAPKCCSRSGCG